MTEPHTFDASRVFDWVRAKTAVANARKTLSAAQDQERQAVEALAEWLVPADAKHGDVITLPISDAFLEVVVCPSDAREVGSGKPAPGNSYTVRWRNDRAPSKS